RLRLGILAYKGAEAALGEWEPLQTYLSEALPQYRLEFFYGDLTALRTAVSNGELEFVLTNPGQYVELEAEHGVGRIATLEQGQLAASNIAVGAAVVALRERHDMQSLDDLRGRVLAATQEDARSEEHTSELQSRENLVCRLLLEKKKKQQVKTH